jgi:DNA helicase-2/ATP-dependent DNA helicase PcrA
MHDEAAGTLDMIGLRDHSVTNEYRIFGPPGTGKTRSATRHIRHAVDRFGYNSVMATSFTRAAAIELTGRDVPIDPDRIGTLHSFCFHALGRPLIAEANVRDWNRENPRLSITPVSRDRRLAGEDSNSDEDPAVKGGDRLLQQLNCCRGRMLPQEDWPTSVREFASRWSRYKFANALLDFSDLIDTALRDLEFAPNKPAVIVADEAQDLNPMQLNLLRKWGRRADHFVLAGDDDQTIYSWTGASPDGMLNPDIPGDHNVFLRQSQRVPRAVHSLVEQLIGQVSRRQQKYYLPRPEDGHVYRLSGGGYRAPEYGILKTVEKHLAQGKSIMLLASCSYMLRPLLAALRKTGIPFHNPYRKANGFWNPLRLGSPGSAARRILSLLGGHPGWAGAQRSWDCRELLAWAEWLAPEGILRVGARDRLPADSRSPAPIELLAEVFESNVLESLFAAYARDYSDLLRWWRSHLAAEFRARTAFPAKVALGRGAHGLVDDPRVVVGTIHSVKGGQADVVYLFPDLSKAADAQYRRCGPPRDSVIRTFYVGATRARETLYICDAEGAGVSI